MSTNKKDNIRESDKRQNMLLELFSLIKIFAQNYRFSQGRPVCLGSALILPFRVVTFLQNLFKKKKKNFGQKQIFFQKKKSIPL